MCIYIYMNTHTYIYIYIYPMISPLIPNIHMDTHWYGYHDPKTYCLRPLCLHLASPLSGTCKICAAANGAECMLWLLRISLKSTGIETKRPDGYDGYNQQKSDLTSKKKCSAKIPRLMVSECGSDMFTTVSFFRGKGMFQSSGIQDLQT